MGEVDWTVAMPFFLKFEPQRFVYRDRSIQLFGIKCEKFEAPYPS